MLKYKKTKKFHDRLKEVLKHFKIKSNSTLANMCELPERDISSILKGKRPPSFEEIIKIIDILEDVNLEWLLLGTGSMIKINILDYPTTEKILESFSLKQVAEFVVKNNHVLKEEEVFSIWLKTEVQNGVIQILSKDLNTDV